MAPRRNAPLIGLLVLAAALSAVLAGCTESESPEPEPTASPPPLVVVELEFGVWGTDEEVAAYRDVVEVYDEETDEVTIELITYATHRELLTAVKAGEIPDVFLSDRSDLAYLLDEGVTQPIGERLDERDVEFGDDYSRAALEAFSFDRDLQCMPYGISPLVVYYNTALVDFERMAERELDVPNLERRTSASGGPSKSSGWPPSSPPGRDAEPAASTCRRPSTGCHPSSSAAAAASSTTTTSPPRWTSPPTTVARPSSSRCRCCATRA